MGLFNKVKKNALGLIDKEAREKVREERMEAATDRQVNRYEKELALKEKNLEERMERRKMLSGEKPLSVREFGKSKLREASNNAKIDSINTFTRENVYAGAKTTGKAIGKGLVFAGKKAAEYERRTADFNPPQQPRRPRRERSFSTGFDFGTAHVGSSYDIQKNLLYGSEREQKRQPKPTDITSSLLGSGGKKSKSKRSKAYDPFDFSDILG